MSSFLYIHCGLHKTGTTSLQRFLTENSGYLRSHGFMYPESERCTWAPHGHHDYPLRVMGDRRYVPFKAKHELETELTDFKGHVILSSEAFESLLLLPKTLKPLIDLAVRTNRQLTFVIYLRPQPDYAISLYRELVEVNRLGDLFNTYIDDICSNLRMRWNEELYEFDYGRILDSLSQINGSKCIVRNYKSLIGGSVIPDFLAAIGLTVPDDPGSAVIWDNNKSLGGLGSILSSFYKNRVGRSLTESEKQVIKRMCDTQLPLRMSRRALDKVIKVFARSNNMLPWSWGRLDGDNDRAEKGYICADKVFTAETQWLIAEEAQNFASRIGGESECDPLFLTDYISRWLDD